MAALLLAPLVVGNCAADDCVSLTAEALDRLKLESTGGWSFVIVDHLPSGKFVQFALEKGAIFIDLPTQTLNAEEEARARRLFAEAGVPGPQGVETIDPGTGEMYLESVFQLNVGDDSDRAGQFGCRVLREVYLLPEDAELTTTVSAE